LTQQQSIVVNDSYTAQQLVENVLVNSSCVVSNFTVKGDPFSGSQNSFGYFNNQGEFSFTEGILVLE
jgi:hypothetical protein